MNACRGFHIVGIFHIRHFSTADPNCRLGSSGSPACILAVCTICLGLTELRRRAGATWARPDALRWSCRMLLPLLATRVSTGTSCVDIWSADEGVRSVGALHGRPRLLAALAALQLQQVCGV